MLALVICVSTNSNINCSFDVESTSHNILHCPMYNDERHTPLSTIKKTSIEDYYM